MTKQKTKKVEEDEDLREIMDSMVTLRPVYVPVDLHSRAKSKSAAKGVSLKSVVIELLEEYLARP